MSISDRLAAITTRADKATSLTLGDDNARDCYNIVEDDVPWLVEQVRKRDAALQAVIDLHIRDEGCGNPDCCDFCEHCLESWPCPTVLAIEDGLREDT